MPLVDYCGAGSPIRLSELGASWVYQPKIDGTYARATTDRHGRIVTLLGRSGRPILSDLTGIPTGLPDAVLHGEIEAHTEAGVRAARLAGFARLHLFDLSRAFGRPVHSRPYSERRDVLVRGIESAELVESWRLDEQGDAHDRSGRYVAAVPHDVRRCPVVPQLSSARAAWDRWVQGEQHEGIVAVALTAALGRRGSKRKVKEQATIDATIVSIQGGAAQLVYAGHSFVVSARGANVRGASVGDVVEVLHDGWYERDATPRFARIVRVRKDLQ